MRPLVAIVLILAIPVVQSTAAHAQGASSQAAAQALFEEARALVESGKFAEACPKLAESQRLDPGAGTLLNLGNCYEKNGQSASAWVTYKDAAAAADIKHRTDWSQRARERAAATEKLLSRLIIEVPAASRLPGLEIRRDGISVGSAEWGTAIPVDPGQHTIEVAATGKTSWQAVVDVAPKGARASVSVPVLEDARHDVSAIPVATGQPSAPVPASVSGSANDEGTTNSPGMSPQKTAGIVVLSAGVAGVAVGAVFGILALGKNSDATRLCPQTACASQDGISANDTAKSDGTISTIAFAAGGVAAAAGAVLFFTAPKPHGRETSAWRVTPAVGPKLAGLSLGGAF